MNNYKIERDDLEKILICRVEGFIDDEGAERLARDWRSAIIAFRTLYPDLKTLFDNSHGNVMSPKAAVLMADATRDLAREGDRTAVLAANSLAKLQAKRTMSGRGEVFISEKAARLWLAA